MSVRVAARHLHFAEHVGVRVGRLHGENPPVDAARLQHRDEKVGVAADVRAIRWRCWGSRRARDTRRSSRARGRRARRGLFPATAKRPTPARLARLRSRRRRKKLMVYLSQAADRPAKAVKIFRASGARAVPSGLPCPILLRQLKTTFGYSTFRPLQREIIEATLAGQDVFCAAADGWRQVVVLSTAPRSSATA